LRTLSRIARRDSRCFVHASYLRAAVEQWTILCLSNEFDAKLNQRGMSAASGQNG
jgi:hypothetical protein